MFGAIVGDILGSVYEGGAAPARTSELFPWGSSFTDDTVCTIAVAHAMLDNLDVVQTLQAWGRRYPSAGYGGYFRKWLFSANPQPYESFGNGALMRVAPAIALSATLHEAQENARRVTAITHNHPKALKAVEQYTCALWEGLHHAKRASVVSSLVCAGVKTHDVDDAHGNLRFSLHADEALEDVLTCLQPATSFESLMRECLYHGGDTDTICAIAGPLGEAVWGIEEPLVQRAMEFLDDTLKDVVGRLYLQLQALHPAIWGAD